MEKSPSWALFLFSYFPPMDTYSIRPATDADIDSISELIDMGCATNELVSRTRKQIAFVIWNFLVAEVWWKIIWCTSWEVKFQKFVSLVHSRHYPWPYEDTHFKPVWAEIRSHFVLENHRKKGIGPALIRAAVLKCIREWVPEEEIYLATGIPEYFISKCDFGYFNAREKTVLFYKWNDRISSEDPE